MEVTILRKFYAMGPSVIDEEFDQPGSSWTQNRDKCMAGQAQNKIIYAPKIKLL